MYSFSVLLSCFIYNILFFKNYVFHWTSPLNVYQINILQNLLLTYKSKNGICPTIFQSKFKPIEHKYPTRQKSQRFYLPKASIKTSKFRISYRVWNNVLSEENKLLVSPHAFKNQIKHKLLNNDNELCYF